MNDTHEHVMRQRAPPLSVTPLPHTEFDPVCGMKLVPNPAKSVEHQGQRYFCCNQRWFDKFRTSPTQYVTATARASASPEIGLDTGAAFLFSVVALLFPGILRSGSSRA
ncbi:MAG: YHS domain-containing protein [Casimicrobiaceae bacterium]